MDKSKSKYYDICKDNNEDAIILDHVVTERLVVNDIQIEGKIQLLNVYFYI